MLPPNNRADFSASDEEAIEHAKAELVKAMAGGDWEWATYLSRGLARISTSELMPAEQTRTAKLKAFLEAEEISQSRWARWMKAQSLAEMVDREGGGMEVGVDWAKGESVTVTYRPKRPTTYTLQDLMRTFEELKQVRLPIAIYFIDREVAFHQFIRLVGDQHLGIGPGYESPFQFYGYVDGMPVYRWSREEWKWAYGRVARENSVKVADDWASHFPPFIDTPGVWVQMSVGEHVRLVDEPEWLVDSKEATDAPLT